MATTINKKDLKWFEARIGKKIACSHPSEVIKELTVQNKNHALQLCCYSQNKEWVFDEIIIEPKGGTAS